MKNMDHDSKQLPVYIVQQSSEGMNIAYNLTGASSSDMRMFLSEDHKRLHVVGKKMFDDMVDEFLWTFSLPKTVDCSGIQMERRNDFYVISVPMKKFWAPKVRKLIPHSNLHLAPAI